MNEVSVIDASYDEMSERKNVPPIADDNLMRVAEMAEKRINAVVKIKQMALKVTNARDWTDQGGNPYLQVSGSEKVANLFNISWRLDEPTVETEPDGHFTYTMRGIFSIPGRSISAEGSRSSKDPFFKKYDWIKEEGKKDKRVEKPISAIDRRDVRMAALTNLLGNGITRLLGIRNLSYGDLEAFAGITKAMIATVDYKGKGQDKPPLKEPEKKATAPSEVTTPVFNIEKKDGVNPKTQKPYIIYGITGDGETIYKTFDAVLADLADTAKKQGIPVKIAFTTGKYGNTITALEVVESREVGSEG